MKILNKKIKGNRGMTYVELIIVLSIFVIMTSVVLFNYGKFQERVDIKSLANDIALQVVQAQKFSENGELPPASQPPTVSPWRPSYGIYIKASTSNSFDYFADLNQNLSYDSPPVSCPSAECLSRININKGDTISSIQAFYAVGGPTTLTDLTVFFTRPNGGATIKSATSFTGVLSYVQINITSPHAVISTIQIYPSGRIQIN